MVVLEVFEGAQRRSVELTDDPVRIGRGADCELQLPPDPTVSRLHASLSATGTGWLLTDLSSRNGTYVNGHRISGQQPVGPADRIMIGPFVLVPQSAADALIETIDAGLADRTRAQLETGLSQREVEVLRLVAAGDSDRVIADKLFISVKTVHSHLERIRDKTGARRRPELIRYAMDHGVF